MAATSLPLPARLARLAQITAWLVPASLMASACSSGEAALNEKVAAGEAAAKRAETAADRAESAVRKAGGSAAPAVVEENEPEPVNVDPGEIHDLPDDAAAQAG